MPLAYILILSAFLFSVGLAVVLVKKNAIVILMGIELMLNAANLNFAAASTKFGTMDGQIFSLFVIVVAAAEAAVGLAIVVKIYQHYKTVDMDKVNKLKG